MRMRLDSSANIYPAIATGEYPQIYRLTAEMVTPVVPDYLRQAVGETLPFFPAFHVRLKRGKRWYYLENTDGMPEIRKRTEREARPFPEEELQFRFLYEGCRIHLEAFHALTDGSGALHFLHAVCYRYCQLVYPNLLPPEALEKRYGLEGAERTGDAYQHVDGRKGSFWKLLGQKRAFRIPGRRLPGGKTAELTVRVPLSQVRKAGRAYGATVCELLTAACLYALHQEYGKAAGAGGRRLRIAVPVNLRPFFEEETEKNFFTCIPVEAVPGKDDTLAEMMEEIREQFGRECSREYLEQKVAAQVAGQRTAVSGYTPLFLKNWFLNRVYRFNGYSTMVLSNLGRIRPEKEFLPCIRGYRCELPLTEREPVKISVLSYGDELVFTMNSSLTENGLYGALIRILRQMGIRDMTEESGGSEFIKQQHSPNRRISFASAFVRSAL